MKPKVIAIGTFDGVHRGHRSVLKVVENYAKEHDFEPVAITFDRHPLELINPERRPDILTPLNKKEKLLREAGSIPKVLKFDEQLRSTTARELLKKLHDTENVKALVIGYDNTFGSDGVNMSLEDYRNLGAETGIDVITAPEIKEVSSSAIRKAVKAGDMGRAMEMLGRPYSITGIVGKGNRLGHSLGFPTANLIPKGGIALPKPGVYAAVVKDLSDGNKYPAMVNIGTRPTVMQGDNIMIESHLFNFNGDLYGKEITIRFIKRLRDEFKFSTVEALRQQLEDDADEAKSIVEQYLKKEVLEQKQTEEK